MSFFTLSSGQIASGEAKEAFIQDFTIIPNNTMALASIEECDMKEYNGEEYYQVTWKLINEPFKNRIVRQKIKVFDREPKISDRAKQMFMLLFNTCKVNVLDKQKGPVQAELYQLRDKVCGIKIREWQMNGKEGNSVSEIHPSLGFVEEVGIKLEAKPQSPKSSYDYNEVNPPFMDSDISF